MRDRKGKKREWTERRNHKERDRETERDTTRRVEKTEEDKNQRKKGDREGCREERDRKARDGERENRKKRKRQARGERQMKQGIRNRKRREKYRKMLFLRERLEFSEITDEKGKKLRALAFNSQKAKFQEQNLFPHFQGEYQLRCSQGTRDKAFPSPGRVTLPGTEPTQFE